AVDVVEGRTVLQTRRTNPVERHRNTAPGSHGRELLLARVVVQPATIYPHAAAEDQSGNPGAVVQIIVIPVINTGANDDSAFAVGLLRSNCELTRQLNDGSSPNSGELLLPCWSVGDLVIFVVGRVISGKPSMHPVLGHQQIQSRSNRNSPVDRVDVADGHAPPKRSSASEVDK